MTDMKKAMRILHGGFSTAIMQINHPIHQGKPNPYHGKFFFVGSIPPNCHQDGKSLKFDTEQQAIDAARKNGATRIQRVDCSFA